jgi:hypothetical protein
MFEKFTSEHMETFKQRYEGTYGHFRNDEVGRKLLVKLTAIQPARCTFVDAQDIEYRLNPDTERKIGFEFLPPKSAWYNTPKGALFVKRIPARQFHRGVSESNVRIYQLDTKLGVKAVTFDVLGAIYDDAFDPRTAILRRKDKEAVALSGQFALDSKGGVYLLTEKIGEAKQGDGKFTFSLDQPELFATELTDACRAINHVAEFA